MSLTIKNEFGSIVVDNETVAKIAGLAALDCYGIVGMASKNVKDGLVTLLRRDNLSRGIKLSINNDKISLDLHIIVEYGTNIPVIAESLIETVKYRVEEYTGLSVIRINIFVEGVRVDK